MSEITQAQFVISRARHAREKTWNRQVLTFEQFLDTFSNHREDNKKDGIAFVPGEIVGPERKATAISQIYFAVYDIDTGQTYDAVRDMINERKFEAVMFTTYSHLKTKSHIKTDNFVRWCTKHKIETNAVKPPHTQENVERYIDEMEDRAKFGGSFVVAERLDQTPDGMQICVVHAPIEKFRVVFPLAKPFTFASHGYTSAEQIQQWKRWYVGIATDLGLKFDMSCADPPRLYYFPSHPPGVETYRLDHLISDPENPDAIKRTMLDFNKFRQVEVESISKRRVGSHVLPSGDTLQTGSGILTPRNGPAMEIEDWLRRNGNGLGPFLQAYLTISVPEIFRGQEQPEKFAEGMRHIECPFEEYHTNAGGTGTFLHTNNGEGYPRIHCMHNACQGHRNEDYIGRMLELGWLDAGALEVMKRARAMVAAGGETDPEALIRAEIAKAQIAPETKEDTADETPAVDRDVVIASLEHLRSTQGTINPKLLQQLGEISNIADYEVFWRKHATNYNYTRDAATDIHLIALTDINFPVLRLYYKEHVARLSLRLPEFEVAVEKIRQTISPLANWLEVMIQKRMRNTDLDGAVKRAAMYYNIAPADVKKMYDMKFGGYVNEVESEIREAAVAFNERYAKLVEPEDTRFIDLQQWRETGRCQPLRIGALEKQYSNHRYTLDYGDPKPKEVPLFRYWLERIPDHKVYNGRVFDPSNTSAPDMFNTFVGFRQVKPIPGDWGLIADHLKTVWCGGSNELFNWLITKMANIVQQPGTKYPTGVAIIGKQGTGKSIILEHGLLPIVAPYGRISSKRDDLTNKFNSVFAECIVYVGEESVFAGDPGAMQKIKAYLSGDRAEIEVKGKESSSERLFTRFFFTSNDEHALRLEPGDRRFLVLEAATTHIRDVEYFEAMRSWLETVGRSHFYDALLTWKPDSVGMDWKDLNDAPITNVKLRQIKMSHDTPKRFYLDLLVYGSVVGLPEDRLEYGNIEWPLDKEMFVPLRIINAALRDYVSANGNRTYDKDKGQYAFETVTGKPWYTSMVRRAHGQSGVEVVCVRFPPRREVLDAQRGKLVDDAEYEIGIGLGDKKDVGSNDPAPGPALPADAGDSAVRGTD